MNSEGVLNLIGTATAFSCRPSELFSGELDEYAAYCLDEACAFILSKMKDGQKPVFPDQLKFKSFKDFYKKYGR